MWIQRLRDALNIDFPSQRQLENLQYYKYAAVDKSYVTKYILRHYWNWAITLFPVWIAPNLITLIGLLFIVFNVLLVLIYVPDLETDAPSWIYFSFAAGLWLYSTFDNVDGKQARRTGTSSPLGELFDHGCDALNTTFVTILQCAALGLGHTSHSAIMLMTTVAGFYFSTAEEYYTQVLYLGIVNGPTEGIILTCLAFIWSGFYGASSWQTPLSKGLPFIAPLFPEGTTAASLFVWSTVFFFFLTVLPTCCWSIYNVCRDKTWDPLQAFTDVCFPIAVFALAEYCWLLSPYSIIFKDQHLCLFALTVGILFGLMASSIILAHLTKSPYPNLAGFVMPVVAVAILVNAPLLINVKIISPGFEYFLLWIMFLGACAFYYVWASLVIDGFCGYLGIRCLSILKRPRQTDQVLSVQVDDALLDSEERGTNIVAGHSPQKHNTIH